jgi:3-hydroxyisobutyrate dehydrogenase-like beta-hydroxyacid dehydrogenase
MASPAQIRRVAFLGLGTMGRPMAASLRRAGFEVVAWNRTRERAESFAAEHGAEVADTPAAAAAAADAVITMVTGTDDVEQVLLGEDGAAAGLAAGGLCIDMSTIAVAGSRAIAARLGERGIDFLDAPVTGSLPGAESATLTIMVGGPEAALERARPVFEAMGRLIVHVGEHGQGMTVKLINNTLAAANAAVLGEMLVLARRAGVDTDKLRKVLASGSGNSAMLEVKAEPMLAHDFEPWFRLEHMLKDVRYCLEEAARLGVEAQLTRTTESEYAVADADGRGGDDFAAVVTVPEAAAG